MKMKNYDSGIRKLGSLHELKTEKARLSMEVQKTQEGISSDYRNILREFTFSSIIGTVVEQITLKTSALSNAFDALKSLISKFRSKKKKKIRNS